MGLTYGAKEILTDKSMLLMRSCGVGPQRRHYSCARLNVRRVLPRYELTAIKDTDLSEDEGVVELAAAAPEFPAATLQDNTPVQDVAVFQDNDAVNDDMDMELVQEIAPVEFDNQDDVDTFDDTTRRGLATAPVAVLYSDDKDVDTVATPIVDIAAPDDVMELNMVAAPPTGALTETFPEVVAPVVNDIVADEPEEPSEEPEVDDGVTETETVIEDIIEDPVVQIEEDIAEAEEEVTDETPELEATSPKAAAAAEVSGRLDALIDEPSEPETETAWPDSLITASIQPDTTGQTDSATTFDDSQPADVVIDELQSDDALRGQETREGQFNTQRYVEYTNGVDASQGGLWAFFTMMIVGLTLLLAGLGINLKGAVAILGENGPFVTIAAMAIGCLLLLGGGWYLIKALFFKD